jgi:hypothetical protein
MGRDAWNGYAKERKGVTATYTMWVKCAKIADISRVHAVCSMERDPSVQPCTDATNVPQAMRELRQNVKQHRVSHCILCTLPRMSGKERKDCS